MEVFDLLAVADPAVGPAFRNLAFLAWGECRSEFGVQAILALLVAAHAAIANRSGSLPYGVHLPNVDGIVARGAP